MEANMQILEGAQYRLRVALTNAAGEQLPPELFCVYAGAFCPGYPPARFHAERTAEEWVLTMPGLKPGRVPWNWQLLAAEYATGVEWLLAAGEVTVTPRHATGRGHVDPGELKITATLDETTLQMTVQVGESTSACSLAVVAAQNSARAADTSAKAADTSARAADTSAKAAADSARDAAASSKAAADEVTKAAAEVEKAKLERETAATHATAAARSAQKAMAAQQAAEQASQAAAQAQTGAEQARTDADAAKRAAQTSEQDAKASADAAAADKAAAEQAKNDALAAQSTAEEQAAIATKAAADARAPESIAAQAARPATMLLVRDELLSILGDASLFDLDTDGQKIIVHTDRLSDDKLAAVNDMLERFVPGFLEVVQYNHHIEVSWRDINKYANCVNAVALKAVNPDYENDLTSDKSWVYPCHLDAYWNWLANNETVKHLYVEGPFATTITGIASSSQVETAHIYAPNVKNVREILYGCRKLVKVTGYMPNLESAAASVKYTAIEEWSIPIPKLKDATECFEYCYNLKRVLVDFPNLYTAAYFFNRTILDKESTLRVLNSIPSWSDGQSHPITIGIHIDHQTDEDVLAAIANAEAKGWTLTVQWNGTPTSAASVMRFGQIIYAKVGERERPDDTTERVLDWGHYVTDETGYETFRSLESAYEYFGLPMPE